MINLKSLLKKESKQKLNEAPAGEYARQVRNAVKRLYDFVTVAPGAEDPLMSIDNDALAKLQRALNDIEKVLDPRQPFQLPDDNTISAMRDLDKKPGE